MAVLLFESASGLVITFAPFHAETQYLVLFHTAVGALTLLPLAWYCARHWVEYRHYALSHIVLLGYVALLGLAVCCGTGLVLMWQGIFAGKISAPLRWAHLVSTVVTLAGLLPHLLLVFWKALRGEASRPAINYCWQSLLAGAAAMLLSVIPAWFYAGTKYVNTFPEDYHYLYGTNRPFAPSLARTDSGGAFDARSLAGSDSCGTAGCHEQILEEWKPSAHRYAAMDTVFLGIQEVMAKQNGAESTRYCGGCHDPISLFSGTKNIFVENLTGLHGYQEGVSCLSCHAIRETDVKGNANYTVTQPKEYLWQWETNGFAKVARDFLIRTYPAEHNKLSKRMFKKPEYCAACHKQFIDAEVNRVGWVQLQNQYDNWASSHWNHKGNARKTVECRECHMPLVASYDPAAGDALDYNRSPKDKKHRSHRFIASNQLMPMALKLEGWEEQVRQTEQWLEGKFEIPEIKEKWAEGPIVKMVLSAPESIGPNENIPLRVVMAANKVGHDFPTGPLDIIQSWLEVRVTDDLGNQVYSSGKRDGKNFIEPGTFLFKAEPVDQHGNLIDRHNLWEMVGVRYRRALFPGYSDSVQFLIPCSGVATKTASPATPLTGPVESDVEVPAPPASGTYKIDVALKYRKVDQFLLNYLFGETNKLTSPVSEIARSQIIVRVNKNKPLATR
ncbi:MAG: multiheme c-type cytochrome [Limisphaerales bacterium]